MTKKMDESAVAAKVAEMPGWSVKDGKLHREYKFADFPHAFGMMATAAPAIEKMDHHPEWSNVYKTVEVTLSTHDAGGVTGLDIALAEAMERIAGG